MFKESLNTPLSIFNLTIEDIVTAHAVAVYHARVHVENPEKDEELRSRWFATHDLTRAMILELSRNVPNIRVHSLTGEISDVVEAYFQNPSDASAAQVDDTIQHVVEQLSKKSFNNPAFMYSTE